MNICMVVHAYYPWDESRVQREAKALVEKGHSVDVICLRKGNEHPDGIADGVIFYRLPVKRYNNPGLLVHLAEYCSFFLLVLLKLNVLYFKRGYKVIHFHNPPDILAFTAIVPKLWGVKIILDIHDLMPELYATKFDAKMRHPLVRVLIFGEKIACRFADNVFTVTEIWKNRLLERGVPEKKCKILMNSPDETIFKPITVGATSRLRNVGVYNLVYHGTLVKRYGIDIAIRAVNIVKDTIPGVKLNIIGEGETLNELIELTEALGIQENVYFNKQFVPVTELPDILSNMDAGIVPNRADCFTKEVLNAKLLEYVAMGIPVISASTPGIRYYFNDKMLIFFTPGNENELARKIIWAYNNPDELKKFIKNAKQFLIQYGWEKEKEMLHKSLYIKE